MTFACNNWHRFQNMFIPLNYFNYPYHFNSNLSTVLEYKYTLYMRVVHSISFNGNTNKSQPIQLYTLAKMKATRIIRFLAKSKTMYPCVTKVLGILSHLLCQTICLLMSAHHTRHSGVRNKLFEIDKPFNFLNYVHSFIQFQLFSLANTRIKHSKPILQKHTTKCERARERERGMGILLTQLLTK